MLASFDIRGPDALFSSIYDVCSDDASSYVPAFDDHSWFEGNILFPDPKNTTHWFAVMDSNDSRQGGFQRLCK